MRHARKYGELLREFRTERGWTLEELGLRAERFRRLGRPYSHALISRIERGKVGPTPAFTHAMVGALGLSSSEAAIMLRLVSLHVLEQAGLSEQDLMGAAA